MRWWKWFALAVLLWTLVVAGFSYAIYDPRECAPIDESGCVDVRE